MRHLTPREIVSELDRYIVGQHDAKRAVAVAIRNRWRRQQLPVRRRSARPQRLGGLLRRHAAGSGDGEDRRLGALRDIDRIIEIRAAVSIRTVGDDDNHAPPRH